MKTLVTGAAGSIGSYLCEALLKDGHTVIGLDDLSCGRTSNLTNIDKDPRFHFVLSDITNDPMLDKYFEDVDWVFHLAAKADIVPSVENPSAYFETNVSGTLKVLEASRSNKVKRFIYAASSSCYGIPDEYPTKESAAIRPMYPYALTKWLGEEMVMHWGYVYEIPVVSLRLFNVYGPRARTNGTYGAVFGVFLSQLAHALPLTVVGDGKQSRDFTFVTDAVRAFIMAAESKWKGVKLNVGSGNHYSINDLVDLLDASDVIPIPDRPGEPKITFADTTRIKTLLGWSPEVSFTKGVGIMKDSVNNFYNAPLWTVENIEKATKPWFDHLGAK